MDAAGGVAEAKGAKRAWDKAGRGRTGFTLAEEEQLEHVLLRLPRSPVLLDPLLNLIVHPLRIRLPSKSHRSLLHRLSWRRRNRCRKRVLRIQGTARAIHVESPPERLAGARGHEYKRPKGSRKGKDICGSGSGGQDWFRLGSKSHCHSVVLRSPV